jgi:hypothetical protein
MGAASGAPRAVQRQIRPPARSSLERCDTAPRLCASDVGTRAPHQDRSDKSGAAHATAQCHSGRGVRRRPEHEVCAHSAISVVALQSRGRQERRRRPASCDHAHGAQLREGVLFRNRWALIVSRWSARCSKRYDSGCRRPCSTQSWTVRRLLNTCRRLRVPNAAMCRACVLVIGCAIPFRHRLPAGTAGATGGGRR